MNNIIYFFTTPVLADYSSATCVDTDIGNIVYVIKILVDIMKIAAPVLLIILGALDFFKATMAGNEQDMDKNKKRFVTRIVIAVVIFLLISVFQLLTNVMATANVNNSNAWLSCWNDASYTTNN